MMNFTSLLHKPTDYSSTLWRESEAMGGVRYAIHRVSLSQRIELSKSVRALTLDHEFLKAGDAADQLAASTAELLARKLYLEWGLAEIQGLTIDGQPATAELLAEKGPERLSDEIVTAIQAELGLSEKEIKNF